MFVRPVAGLKVRDPDTRELLPEAGKEVPETAYWLSLLHHFHDVELVTPAPHAG